MKSTFLISTIIFAAAVCSAQPRKMKFHSIISAGIAAGQSNSAAAYETVTGFAFSSWFAGLGAGLDNYHFKSLPLFVGTRKYFGKERSLFVYGNIGENLPAQKQADKQFIYYTNYYFEGGFYADGGIGYRFPLIKKTSLVFSLGNSYKSMQAHTKMYAVECFATPCPATFKDYHYNFYRLILKAGLLF